MQECDKPVASQSEAKPAKSKLPSTLHALLNIYREQLNSQLEWRDQLISTLKKKLALINITIKTGEEDATYCISFKKIGCHVEAAYGEFLQESCPADCFPVEVEKDGSTNFFWVKLKPFLGKTLTEKDIVPIDASFAEQIILLDGQEVKAKKYPPPMKDYYCWQMPQLVGHCAKPSDIILVLFEAHRKVLIALPAGKEVVFSIYQDAKEALPYCYGYLQPGAPIPEKIPAKYSVQVTLNFNNLSFRFALDREHYDRNKLSKTSLWFLGDL
jgi:hypothetical protein